MFSDNAQVSQSPIQRCLYLHAHSELFPAVPRSWSRQVLCKQFSQLYSFVRCFSTKTWLIKPDNVTKSSKMGPHVIQNSEKRNCWLNSRRWSQWTQRRLGKRRWQVPAHVRVKFSGSPNWAWVNSNLLKSRFWSARRHAWELLNSRRLLQTNKPGDPHFLFFQFFLLIAKKSQTKFKKILWKEFCTTPKFPFFTFIKNRLHRIFFKNLCGFLFKCQEL